MGFCLFLFLFFFFLEDRAGWVGVRGKTDSSKLLDCPAGLILSFHCWSAGPLDHGPPARPVGCLRSALSETRSANFLFEKVSLVLLVL